MIESNEKINVVSLNNSAVIRMESATSYFIHNQKTSANQQKKSKLSKILNNLKPSNLKQMFKNKQSHSDILKNSSEPVAHLIPSNSNEIKKVKSTSFLNVDSQAEVSFSSTVSMPDIQEKINKANSKSKRKLKKENTNKTNSTRKHIKDPPMNVPSSRLYFDEESYMDAFRFFDTDG